MVVFVTEPGLCSVAGQTPSLPSLWRENSVNQGRS